MPKGWRREVKDEWPGGGGLVSMVFSDSSKDLGPLATQGLERPEGVSKEFATVSSAVVQNRRKSRPAEGLVNRQD